MSKISMAIIISLVILVVVWFFGLGFFADYFDRVAVAVSVLIALTMLVFVGIQCRRLGEQAEHMKESVAAMKGSVCEMARARDAQVLLEVDRLYREHITPSYDAVRRMNQEDRDRRFFSNGEWNAEALTLAWRWGTVGLLCHSGLISTELVISYYCPVIVSAWRLLKPDIQQFRRIMNEQRYGGTFEWLAERAEKHMNEIEGHTTKADEGQPPNEARTQPQ